MTPPVLWTLTGPMYFCIANEEMKTIRGIDALAKAETVSKAGGDFSIAFFPYNRKKPATEPTVQMKVYEHCTMRRPLPHEKWDVDGKNYFLFSTQDGEPRICHRSLIRFMSFSSDGYKLNKLLWYHE